MSFHTKYRPTELNDVIGNIDTKRKLNALFREGRFEKQVFLFHGASGCGKTTFAGIMAEMLGCSARDFKMINTGNNRGIDTAREVLRTVKLAPMEGNFKVILFDEVHQTTKDFQSALLTTLEDTPHHVYFILCTTDPQKLLPQLRNRCTEYEVKKLSDKGMMKLLCRVCDIELKTDGIEGKILEKIIEKAEGCARRALLLLEDIIYLPADQQLKAIAVFKTQEQRAIDLCRAILQKESWAKVCKILNSMEDDPESVRRAVLGYINSVILKEDSKRCMVIFNCFKEPFFNTGKAGLSFASYKAVNY